MKKLSAPAGLVSSIAAFLFAGLSWPPGALADETSLAGKWKLDVISGEESRDYILELVQDGKKVSGDLVSPRSGKHPIRAGTFADGRLRIEVPRDIEGQSVVFLVEAKLAASGKFEGTLSIEGNEVAQVVIARAEAPAAALSPAGQWDVTTKTPDGTQEYNSTLEVSAGKDGALEGKSVSQRGTNALRSLKVDGKKFSFELTLDFGGNAVDFIVRAEFADAQNLRGRWHVKESEDVSGEWNARRAGPPPPAATATAKDAAPEKDEKPSPFAGRWFAKTTMPDGRLLRFSLEIAVAGAKATGKAESKFDALELRDGKVEGRRLSFRITREKDGRTEEVEVWGELGDDGRLKGRWKAPDGEEGEWEGRKATVL